jgi:hypothetical protein
MSKFPGTICSKIALNKWGYLHTAQLILSNYLKNHEDLWKECIADKMFQFFSTISIQKMFHSYKILWNLQANYTWEARLVQILAFLTNIFHGFLVDECQNSTWNWIMTTTFHVLSNSSLTNHCTFNTKLNICEGASLSDSDGNHYVNIKRLLDFIFNLQYEPKLPHWQSCWTWWTPRM